MKRRSFGYGAVLLFLTACTAQPQIPGLNNTPAPTNTGNEKQMETEKTSASNEGGSGNVAVCMQGCTALPSGGGLISKETCESGCWIEEAEKVGDASLCSKAGTLGSLLVTGCVMNVAEKSGKLSDCDRISADKTDVMVSSCYLSVGKKTKDTSVCAKMGNSLIKMGCEQAVLEE